MKTYIKPIGAGICSVAVVLGIVESKETTLRTNHEGLALIANSEGCRTKPYSCSAGVLTVGIGSTDKVKKGKNYSYDEIAERFIDDVKQAENCVNTYANGNKMNQGQFNAVTSFVFNVGCRKKSTLFKYARAEKWEKMCNELPRWQYVNGQKSKGILKRRLTEKAMCLQKNKGA